MTDEEMQRKMEFIVEQQAQFAVNIQKLEDAQARAEKRAEQSEGRIGELEGAIVTVVNLVGQLAEAQERTDARLSQLATEITEAQKRTEERLNSLIIVVERYFSNGQGKA